MNGLKVRAAGVALVSVAWRGWRASPALASPGVTVGSVSSLKAGAKAGTLRGEVVNRTGHAVDAKVTVRIQRSGAAAKFVGTHRGARARPTPRRATRSRSSCPAA